MPVHRFLFFVVLFALNLLALAAIVISFGQPEPKGEPERISNQINADRILLQPVGAAPTDLGQASAHPSEGGPATMPPQIPPPIAPAPEAVATSAAAATATAPPPEASAMADTPLPDAPYAPLPTPAAEVPEQTQPVVTHSAPAEPTPEACILYAGLTQEQANALEEAARVHAGAGLRADRDSAPATTAWWVRLPSAGGREAAERRVRELREQGITDYFIFRDPGPNQFAISLGLFKTEGAARQYHSSLERKRIRGVEVAPRNGVLHSLQLRGPADALEPVSRQFAVQHPGAAPGECAP